MPWDKDFNFEINQLFTKEIAPTVQEIREVVEEKHYLRNFCTNLLNDTVSLATLAAGIGTLGVGIMKYDSSIISEALKNLTAPALVGAGLNVVKNALNTANNINDKVNEKKKHDLYFYYAAEKQLKKL
jgi:hypothetical protein